MADTRGGERAEGRRTKDEGRFRWGESLLKKRLNNFSLRPVGSSHWNIMLAICFDARF